jgi:hypothetical protein
VGEDKGSSLTVVACALPALLASAVLGATGESLDAALSFAFALSLPLLGEGTSLPATVVPLG